MATTRRVHIRLPVPESGCCTGHPCDNCKKCMSGRCCRDDNPSYVLPEVGSWPYPIHGAIGALDETSGLLTCHICGKASGLLYSHIRIHDVTAMEYRAYFGLAWENPLIPKELSERKRRRIKARMARDPDWFARFQTSGKEASAARTPEQRHAMFAGRTVRPEIRESDAFHIPNRASSPKKTHCKRGHEFTTENTRYLGEGRGQQCIACNRITSREYAAARRARERKGG